MVGRRLYPKGFLWLAFFPGLLHLKDAFWAGWASSPAALPLLGLFLLGGIHALARIESLKEEARVQGAAFLAFLPLPHLGGLPLPTWSKAPLEAAREALEASAGKVVYTAPKER